MCRLLVSGGQKENTTAWLSWVGLGLTAWLLQGWKGSEKWNCSHAGPWRACWCCWEAAACAGCDPWAPGWGEGPGTMASFMGKLYSANPGLNAWISLLLVNHKGREKVCAVWLSIRLAWHEVPAEKSGVPLPGHFSLLAHEGEFGTKYTGVDQTLWIYSVRHPNRFWT